VQLVAEHPPQAELEAEALTVSPPLSLLKKPQADISLLIALLLQEGHFDGSSFPKTRYSKSLSQPRQ